jgi:two-component system, NarL family, sensor histidine kinase LiaS
MRYPRGLRAKMAMSYVAVTAAAVIAVEAVGISLLLSSGQAQTDLATAAEITAADQADHVAFLWAKAGESFAASHFPVYTTTAEPRPGQAVPDSGGGVRIGPSGLPWTPGDTPTTAAVLVSTTGTVLASSFPAQYPAGSHARLPYQPARQFYPSGRTQGPAAVAWAAAAVTSGTGAFAGTGQPSLLGSVYVQVPARAQLTTPPRDVSRWLWAGALILVFVLVLGAAFGLLSTRSLITRVRRLAGMSRQVAAGVLDQRVQVTGHDELAGLEQSFNDMARQLQDSVAAASRLADASARQAERARIARELHDSVSQHLFSLNLLASGLRRALPPGADTRSEVEAMQHTARTAMREMQALLLEMRPVALAEAGLVPALAALASDYRSRLGIAVSFDSDPAVRAPGDVEHAILRIAQEAVGNAVKHAHAARIDIHLYQNEDEDEVALQVRDDGTGFDPERARSGGGMGLAMMAERATQADGSVTVQTAPGHGTIVTARLPVNTA